MWRGRLERPYGSQQDVMFHRMREAGDGTADSAERLRKEMAGSGLSKMLDFGNGFPETVPRNLEINGELQQVWIQEASARPLEDRLPLIAHERYGAFDEESVSRLVKEDPQLRAQIEQAFAERLIYGDWDNHAGNFVLVETPTGLKVQSIDLDHA